jgi:hypothetical protein
MRSAWPGNSRQNVFSGPAKTAQCVPAAIRPLDVTGKVPVPKKDGRHPEYENHGRIAGR